MRQLKLFSDRTQTQFGGSLLTGRRKGTRPLSLKNSHHLALKAKSSVCLLQSRAQVEAILRKYGARFGVKIYALFDLAFAPGAGLWLGERRFGKSWLTSDTTAARLISSTTDGNK